jgi:hypothetical protein
MQLVPTSGLSNCFTFIFSFAKKHPIISVAITIITTYGIYLHYRKKARIAREREEIIDRRWGESSSRNEERTFNRRLEKLFDTGLQ